MPTRPRPLIAVRLIGPADDVAAHKAHLIAYFQTVYGPAATCRTSTRHASHLGECRTYLTVTPKETRAVPRNLLPRNGNQPIDRQESVR